ncbi:MAG: PQQ-dependent sugar dehydrogenase [Myxococcales bacterium]|nr:PQQ-dependent sugar dehydrogenase [Myxococcales bacterium]
MSMKASGLPTVALLALLTWGCDDEPGGGDGGGVDGAVDAAADVGAGGAGGSPADGGGDRGLIDAMLDGAVADARTPDGMVMDGALTDARITDARFADGAVADAEPPEAAVDPPDAAPDARVVPLDARVDPADAAPDAQLEPADADAAPDAAARRRRRPQPAPATAQPHLPPPRGPAARRLRHRARLPPPRVQPPDLVRHRARRPRHDLRRRAGRHDLRLRRPPRRRGPRHLPPPRRAPRRQRRGPARARLPPRLRRQRPALRLLLGRPRELRPERPALLDPRRVHPRGPPRRRSDVRAPPPRSAPALLQPQRRRPALRPRRPPLRQPRRRRLGRRPRGQRAEHPHPARRDPPHRRRPRGRPGLPRLPLRHPARQPLRRRRRRRARDLGLGLRNPWRMAFDPITGALWTGDVGQNRWEEIDRIEGPGNFGWNTLEGFECYGGGPCDDAGMIPPVWVYGRMQGQSITGGLVYRGPRLPELWGRYLFADYVSGRVWSLRERDGDEPEVTLLAQQASVTHFGADAAGRVYLTTFDAQRPIARLVRAAPPAGEPFPARLSETGCFADTAGHVLAPGVVPYQVNRPFWSDHAEKLRAIAVPEGATVGYRPDDPFVLPVGTVLVKTFLMPQADGSRRRISTRLFTRQADGWRGFVYRWNEAQTDAELLDGARYEVIDTVNGPQTWNYPGQIECALCHLDAAGGALGWSTRQLSGTFELDGVRYDQLDALAAIGLLDGLPPDGPRPAHPRPGEAASLDAEARATLDVNCAPCHRPGGVNARLDLRAQSPLDVTELCERAEKGDLGLDDPHIVAAGDPAASVLVRRMTRRDTAGMPPIGSVVVDAESVDLVSRWIESLESCP